MVLSCQPNVTVPSFLVYKAIRDLESTDHLFINPANWINKQVVCRFPLGQVKCTR